VNKLQTGTAFGRCEVLTPVSLKIQIFVVLLDIEDCYDVAKRFIIYISIPSNIPEDFNPVYSLCFEKTHLIFDSCK